MKKTILLLLFTGLCSSLFGQDITFEAYNPASTLVVPGQPVLRAK